MANPQMENGYTAIANELLEQINKYDFTLREVKIVISVIRYTYGFRRKEAELSLRFLAESANLDYRNVHKTLKKLSSKNVLIIRKHTPGFPSRTIQLNKDYDTWKFPAVNDNDISVVNSAGSQKNNISVVNSTTKNSQNDDKEIKHINKTLNKTTSSVCLLPDELKNIKGFDDMWKDWSAFRNEINKSLTPIAIKVQLSKLVSFKSRGYDVLEIISNSISNNWLDFYEPRENKSPGREDKAKKEYITDKLRWITANEPGWM